MRFTLYDLLGGEHGPLRTVTRGVTYGVLFGAGHGLALGPVFGLTSGAAHGVTLAWEFSRASRGEPKPGFWQDTAMSAVRGFDFALGASLRQFLNSVNRMVGYGITGYVSALVGHQRAKALCRKAHGRG